MMTHEAVETVEALMGMLRTHLSGLATQCTCDLPTRRAIEHAVFQMLNEIADEAARRAGGFGQLQG